MLFCTKQRKYFAKKHFIIFSKADKLSSGMQSFSIEIDHHKDNNGQDK